MKKYDFCILRNYEDIMDYEKKLYEINNRNNTDQWIFKNYKKIDDCRLRSETSSHFQEYYILRNREDGDIIAGAAINYNDKDETQLEKMGFNRIKRSKEKFCEILNFFVDNNVDDFSHSLSLLFINLIKVVISERIFISFVTCSISLKSIFTDLGWEIIETKKINGIEKCMLKYTAKVPSKR